jgi:predicted Ser/Thr protein kinase
MELDEVLDKAVAEDSTTRMDFSEYVDFALENPDRPEFGTAAEYVHEAITHYGTRTVVEDGERKERYRFWDDPWNSGENAVFGNTEMLNEFTDSLRRVARGDAAKMPIIEGETATGKSELTEVMKKGLMHYSQTDEGRIHTVSVADMDDFRPHSEQMWKTYGNPDQSHMTPDDYIKSPVQAEPLSLLKELSPEAGERIEHELQERREKPLPVNIPENTGPVATYLIDRFEQISGDYDSQREMVEDFLDTYARVESFEFESGTGIGEIKSEDEFDSLYERLFAEPPLNSDPSDPRNWSFSGAFTAGNRGVAFLDDADQYIGILEDLQSQIDDNKTKFHGNGSTFSIDTAAIAISNPEDYGARLPNSVYRRLIEFEMNYLTNYATESELLRKMMGEDWDLLDDEGLDPEDATEVTQRALEVEVMEDGETSTVFYAPHTVEAAAIVEVASRLDDEGEVELSEDVSVHEDIETPLDLMEKVELYQKGFITRTYEDEEGRLREERLEKEHFNFPDRSDRGDAETSINATFTRDVLSAAMNEDRSRGRMEIEGHEADLDSVVLPFEILEEMEERITKEKTVDQENEKKVKERMKEVEEHVNRMMEEDVLDAIFHDYRPSNQQLEEYVDRVEALRPGEDGRDTFMENGEEKEPDNFRLKEIEQQYFGFDDGDYEGNEPRGKVSDHRQQIVNRVGINARNGGPVDAERLDPIREKLGSETWEDIPEIRGGEFEDFDLTEWREKSLRPPETEDYDTDTEEVKNTAVWNMVEHQDYNLASAILTAEHVVENVAPDQEEGPEPAVEKASG